MIGKFDAENGADFGHDGLGDEFHAGFGGRSAALADVALGAAADNVVPRVTAVAAAGQDVVQAKLGAGKLLAAVLAAVAVAGEDVSTVELDLLFGQAIVEQEPHDSRHGDIEADGADPIVGVRLELPAELADFNPGLEIVTQVVAVLDVDDLGELAEEQRKCFLGVGDADGEIVFVEHQYVAIDAERRGGKNSWCYGASEDKPSW